ncbi:putative disease resistance protein At1g58400 isoform X2 [Nymphaea colorata]|uniref:putative disease resistance protein At1g58400 isoform X2 n=1 Tax=Nymphaea colorata TaxID=210225 RepID=UPI00129EB966|nr:putative disease resistance protein At1g58400 isoform X2 [Nymphaea colorata]
MAAIPVNFLLERLGTFLVKEAKLLGGIRQEIEKIREELESIKGFLEDADKKRDRNEGIKTWVNQVRRVAYDIEDAIDEFLLRFGTRHAGYGGIMNFLGTLSSAMTQLLPRHNLATRVQEIKKRIVEIAERRRNYDIQMLREDTSPDATIRQWRDYAEANFLEEAEVVGIEKDVKLLVNQLVGGVTEGFIEERSGATAEEVGEDYMLQLIDRSMLQIAETSMDGRVKSCRIHDLMRDLAISISREEEFSFILDMQVRRANVVSPRRMSVFGENKRIEDDEESVLSGAVGNIQLLRSLLFFRVGYISTPNLISHSGQFMLLRVLDLSDVYIEKLPKQIGHLLHLRYLCFRTHWELTHRNRRPKLPRSIGSLQNLETLDIRDTDIRMLPNEIIRLRNLRHLCMAPWNVDMPKGFSNLRCLQTLTGLDGSRKGIAAEIRELKELRRLDIEGVKKEDAEEIYGSISSMRHLFRLRIEHDDDHDDDYGDADFPFGKRLLESPPPRLQVLELRQLWELPDTLGSFNNLSKLTLTDGPFREDPFPRLESLPCLSDLRLYRLYNVDRLECGPLGFLRLRRLQLVDLTSLRTVTFAEGSMPSLKQLWIHHCGLAKVVPHGIQHLKLEVLSIK